MKMLPRCFKKFSIADSKQELDEELLFHIDQQTEANRAAGMPEPEARRQALLAFGGVEGTREQTFRQRPSYHLEVLVQDVRYAVRGFLRAPTFAITIVVTLTLGISVTTAVLSVVDRILFRPLPYSHGERLVSIGLFQSLEPQEFMVGGFFYDWRDRQRPFDMIAAESAVADKCDLGDGNPVQVGCTAFDANFLPMLGVSPVIGRSLRAEEVHPHGAQVALISYALWSSRYNRDPRIVNSTITVDGLSTEIIGVLPGTFELPSLHAASILRPLVLDEAVQRTLSPGAPMRVFGRLRIGVSVEQARAEMDPLYQSALQIIPREIRKDFHLRVRSLRDRQMQEARPVAWTLLGTALSVLLIASANVASLLTARSATRARETAVRSALGASRRRLVAQALTESLLFSAMGAVGGFALAEILVRTFVAIAPASIPYLSHTDIDFRIGFMTAGLAFTCGITFSLVSAFGRPDEGLLSGKSPRSSQSLVVRKVLVAAQISLSMLLLASASLLARSFWNLSRQNLGMTTDSIMTASMTLGPHDYGTNGKVQSFFDQLTSRLRFGPGVTSVAIADALPPAASHNQTRFSSIGVLGRPPAAGQFGGSVTYRWVSPDYFQTLGIRIVRGHSFTQDELTDKSHFVVLSQTLAARLFPGADPIDKELELDRSAAGKVGDVVEKTSNVNDFYQVVGVAADVKNGNLAGEDLPEYYRLRRNNPDDWSRDGAWGGTATIALRTTSPAKVVAPWVRSQVATLDPALPVNVTTMKDQVSSLADGPRFQTLLVTAFAATGFLLALIGVYGVVSLLVTQRTQEFGVRLALGASRSNILSLVLNESLRTVAMGLTTGLVLTFAASHAFTNLLYDVRPYDPISLVFVTITLSVSTLVAAFVPATRAARVNPVVSLRYE